MCIYICTYIQRERERERERERYSYTLILIRYLDTRLLSFSTFDFRCSRFDFSFISNCSGTQAERGPAPSLLYDPI